MPSKPVVWRFRFNKFDLIWFDEETEGDEASTSFKLLLRDCPEGHVSEQVYRCLDSGSGATTDKGNSVVVSADSAGGDLLCWWFGNIDRTRFFLLAASACYDRVMAATRQPLAVFTRSTPPSTFSVVTATSVSAPSELAEFEVVVANGGNNMAVFWRLFDVLICVVVVLTTC